MNSRSIKVSNVERKEGNYGPSLKIGYKPPNGEWENYFVNDEGLFGYFTKGRSITVEYEQSKSGYSIIKGVSEQSSPPSPGPGQGAGTADAEKNASIERQTIVKAWATVKAGTPILAAEFAADVRRIHEDVFELSLDDLRKSAAATLGATEDAGEWPDDG